MSKKYKIAALQMTSVDSIDKNLDTAAKLIKGAAKEGALIAVLPEMFPTLSVEKGNVSAAEAYGDGPIQSFIAKQAKQHNIWVIAGTMPIKSDIDHKIHAASLVYDNNGDLITRYDKIHLFEASFRGGTETYCESTATLPGEEPIVFDSPIGKIGLAVCYDLRFPELFRLMAEKGAEIFVIPAAFAQITGAVHWDILCRARAIENLAYVVAANQTGTHSNGRQTYGHSMIINPWGEVLAQRPDDEGVVVSEIDMEKLHKTRSNLRALEHRKFLYSD
jgi:deaminated glutathione amidase